MRSLFTVRVLVEFAILIAHSSRLPAPGWWLIHTRTKPQRGAFSRIQTCKWLQVLPAEVGLQS